MNRRQFNVLVEEEMKKTFSSYAPFSLIAIDLDGFKHINDTYGHVIGDEVFDSYFTTSCKIFRR